MYFQRDSGKKLPPLFHDTFVDVIFSWGIVMQEVNEGYYCWDLYLVFSLMSSLLSICEELLVLMSVEEISSLCIKEKVFHNNYYVHGRSSLENTSWTMSFSVAGKHRIFIRAGSWSQFHPAITPKAIRSIILIWHLKLLLVVYSSPLPLLSMIATAIVTTKMASTERALKKRNLISIFRAPLSILKKEFPLLHSLGIQKKCQINTLLQEIVNYNCSNLCIKFMLQNYWPGFVILCPSLRTAEQ